MQQLFLRLNSMTWGQVAQAHPQLNLSKIFAVKAMPEAEEEEEGIAKEEVIRTEELAIVKEPEAKIATTEDPEEPTIPSEAQT